MGLCMPVKLLAVNANYSTYDMLPSAISCSQRMLCYRWFCVPVRICCVDNESNETTALYVTTRCTSVLISCTTVSQVVIIVGKETCSMLFE